jgi:hypothetical protein
MTVKISGNSKRLFLSILILFGICTVAALAQKSLSGNLNQPKAHVVSIPPSPTDRVIVDDATGFKANDTILLIQMQGVKILLSPYGTLQNKFGEPGMHEFLIIQSVNGGTNEIVFRNELLKNYDPAGNVQIVRAPYYNSAKITGTLYCDPWNPATRKGGVLALIVGRTLELTGNIDVSGRGFIGGNDAVGDGICWNTNTTRYGQDYYPSSDPYAGYKGEGVANFTEFDAPLLPNYAKGKGQNWTGGGGGNGRYSGGGGGSNRGSGGIGGKEDCFPPTPGGSGGLIADHPSLVDRIYFGGGGGASTSATGLSPSGGNGGGIVIIVTETIKGSGGKILANGSNGGTAVTNGGAGGGGAGGSIALSLNSYGSTPLELYARGGNGGDNPGIFGEGGGGGGGLLYVNTAPTGLVTPYLNGGNPGNYPASTAFAGNTGEVRSGFKAILNGFLFNSIHSSVSGNQSDSVCSNMIPPKIIGTKPVGGIEPYTYLWEKSYNKVTWVPLTNDANPLNYTPTAADAITPTDSVWFRRTITDLPGPAQITDISKPVKFYMQPFIKNNIVGNSDTICFAQNPVAFTSKATLQDGNKIYSFKWMVSTNSTAYNLPSNTYNTETYTPPPSLKITSWYRRTVTSGMCVDSAAIVKLTVLDTIKANKILNYPPDICFGTTFVNLTATTSTTTPDKLEGGDNLYRFKWESNFNGGGWATAPGVSNGPGYNPVELSQRVPSNEYLYRRVVYSGNHNVCTSTSNTVLLKDFPVIANNSITKPSQPVCSGTTPPILVGSQPINGNGVVYNYVWQDSSKLHTWASISGATSINYQPPVLTDTTRYRRIVTSSACTDISKSVIVNVHKPIINTISLLSSGTDTTICNGAVPHRLKGQVATGGTNIPGTYTYQWILSTDNGTTWNNATGGTGVSYQPAALTAVGSPTVYSYRRLVSSGACLNNVSTSTINITVLPSITNNIISANQTVCYNTVPAALTGAAPTGGNGSYTYYWEQSTNNGTTWVAAAGPGINTASGYSPPPLTLKTLYRRTVNSGPLNSCSVISNVITIDIYALPTGIITSTAPITICEGSKVPLVLTLTGASPWTVVYNENSSQITAPSVTSSNPTISASPVTVTALTTYNYSLYSIRDNNGCFATSLSGTRRADVYKIPSANAGPDQIVCGPVVTLTASPSIGTGLWYYPAAVVASTPNGPTVRVTVDSTFTGSSISHKFYWEETNWNCKNRDSVIVTFDKRISSINAGPDTSLYTFDNIYHMIADPVKTSDGQSGIWTILSGTGSFDNPASNKAIVTDLSLGINTFLWTVENGKCSRSDQVKVNVYEIEIPEGFSPNNDPGGYNNKFIIKGLDLINQIAELTVVNGAGSEVFSTSNRNGQIWTDWDGTNSKGLDLPEGTYYYLLKLTSTGSDQVFKKSGFVILKRY